MTDNLTFQVRVRAITWEAEGILGFDLVPLLPTAPLPAVASWADQGQGIVHLHRNEEHGGRVLAVQALDIGGTCETRVLSGAPDHRDAVLSDGEQATNDRMMICCSGAKTPNLVLDL